VRCIVVIPTYNESSNISRLINEIFQLVRDIHILIVDDSSPDGTADIVKNLQKKQPNLHLLQRTEPRSFGKSYVDGFRHALQMGAQFVVQMDADYSHNPRYLQTFLEAIESCDLVLGSRYLNGVSVVNWPIRRLMLSLGANTYIRWITGMKIADATSGYRCWRHRTLASIDFDSIKADGYGFQIEMLYQACKLGFSLREMTIIFIDRVSGSSKISRKMVFEAIWLPWKLRIKSLWQSLFNNGRSKSVNPTKMDPYTDLTTDKRFDAAQ
jgi:dolichol-phosphate mannosyltransferase